MIFDREEAAQRAELETTNDPGTCQLWTRTIFDAESVGDQDGDGDADAIDGWKSEPPAQRHIDRSPPRGVPVAFSGGSRGFGHRAVSLGNGKIRSTDMDSDKYNPGHVGTTTIDQIERSMGVTWLGWSDTISGEVIPLPPKTPTKIVSEVSVVWWNVYIGHDVGDVRVQLKQIIKNNDPDVIFLCEAKRMYGHLKGLGYDVGQFKPKSQTVGSKSNNGNIAVLTKKGGIRSRFFALWMQIPFLGPKQGNPQDPRVYRWVRVRKNGVTWKLGGFHLPFGLKARKESVAAMTKWFVKTWPGRPIVAVTDYQKNAATARTELGPDVHVAGDGIDLAIYDNCRLWAQKNLGKHGSDHAAKKWVFQKTITRS